MYMNQQKLKDVLSSELPDYVREKVNWDDSFEKIWRNLEEDDMNSVIFKRLLELEPLFLLEIPLRLCNANWLEPAVKEYLRKKSDKIPCLIWLYAYLVYDETGRDECLVELEERIKDSGKNPILDQYDWLNLQFSCWFMDNASSDTRRFQCKLAAQFGTDSDWGMRF